MVIPMVGSPPERPSLRRGGAENREQQLRQPGRFEGSMGEIAMIDAGDGEHSDQVQSKGDTNRRPAPADDKNTQTAQVQNYEGKAADPVDSVEISNSRRNTASVIIGVKPLDKKSNKEV